MTQLAPNPYEQSSAQAIISQMLSNLGLDSLAGWAWQRYLAGASLDQINVELQQQPAFQQRFPYLPALAAKGRAISPAEAVATERAYVNVLRSAGLPPGFYDQPADFAAWIEGEVSPAELAQRVQTEYAKVAQAPQAVKDYLAGLTGITGDTATAMIYLDPNRALPELERLSNAAIVGGTGTRYGINLPTSTALSAATQGVTQSQAEQAFSQTAQFAPLYTENLGEQNITQEQAAAGFLGVTPLTTQTLEQRLRTRQAAFGGATAGGVVSQQGAVGLGESRSA